MVLSALDCLRLARDFEVDCLTRPAPGFYVFRSSYIRLGLEQLLKKYAQLNFALLRDMGGGTSKRLEINCLVIWVCAVQNVHGQNGRATEKT
jgi:hypothetical protein